MFSKFIGKTVIIEWEQQTVMQWGRDPIDPDSYRDCGILAQNRHGIYGLIYLPHSFEVQNGIYGLTNIYEADVSSIKESANQFINSLIGTESSRYMANYGLFFGTSSVSCSTPSIQSTNALQKSCNTCTNSNLLNYFCHKHNKHLKDFKGVCSEWTS